MFRDFVRLRGEIDLYGRERLAVNGTRIKAVNNANRNFTQAKLERELKSAAERLDTGATPASVRTAPPCQSPEAARTIPASTEITRSRPGAYGLNHFSTDNRSLHSFRTVWIDTTTSPRGGTGR